MVNFEFATKYKIVSIKDAKFAVENLVLEEWINLKELNHPRIKQLSSYK